MGQRSMNVIALKPGIAISGDILKYTDGMDVTSSEMGTLIIYESNFSPMFNRDGKGEYCTTDLEEEIAVHRFLGQIGPQSFYMIRVGDDLDTRGEWKDHPFNTHPDAGGIFNDYAEALRGLADDQTPLTAAQVDRTRKLTLDYAIASIDAKGGRMVNTAWVVEQLNALKDLPMDASVITG